MSSFCFHHHPHDEKHDPSSASVLHKHHLRADLSLWAVCKWRISMSFAGCPPFSLPASQWRQLQQGCEEEHGVLSGFWRVLCPLAAPTPPPPTSSDSSSPRPIGGRCRGMELCAEHSGSLLRENGDRERQREREAKLQLHSQRCKTTSHRLIQVINTLTRTSATNKKNCENKA